MIVKLVLKSLQHDKMRFATATLGVAAATGLVVWSLGLTTTSMGQSREKVRRMTAPYSCWVSTGQVGVKMDRKAMGAMMRPSREQMMACIPPHVVASIQALPDVEATLPCKVIRTTLDFRPDGRVMQGPPLMASLVLASTSGCPYAEANVTGTWPDPASGEPAVAVCSAVFEKRRLPLPPLGSPLVMITPYGTVTAKISAHIEFKETVNGFPTAFATLGAMRQASGGMFDPRPNLLLCRLRSDAGGKTVKAAVKNAALLGQRSYPAAAAQEGVNRDGPRERSPSKTDDADSRERVSPRTDQGDGALSAVERKDVEAGYASDQLQNFKRQAPLLLTLSVLTALCMLVNALTVGVEQKLRVLALLRAAGMTVRQVARVVMLEGLVIASSGWAVGVLSGWAVLTVFVRRTADAFPEGVVLGWITPVCSAVGVAVITAVSLHWPCRRAMRIRPLDVLVEDQDADSASRWSTRRSPLLGFILLFPMLVFALPLPISAMTRSVLLLTVGMPLHFLGLFLFLPFFVRLVERLTGPAVSAVLGLDPKLLHRRISRHFSRTAGMVITLAVGLGSFSAIHIWGSSMTAPFIPSQEFPDVIVSVLPNGVAKDAADTVAKLEGVDRGRCLNIEAAQFFLPDALTAQVARVSGKLPISPNVLLMGAEPQAAFGGEHPLAPFIFAAGERQAAADALAKGGACLITKMFSRETGLTVGDDLSVVKRPPMRGGHGGRRPDMGGPGRLGGTRGGPETGHRTENVPVQTETFKIAGVVDLNWHLVTSRAQLRGQNNMPGGTMGPVFVSETDARRLSGNEETTKFLWLNLSKEYSRKGALPAGQLLEAEIRKAIHIDDENTVRVHHRDEIADGTIAHGADLIGDMARVPFWSLVVLSTGVITLLIASFQAAAKEIAVMRAIGMTRSQLGRLLLGEALMTGACGIVLSLISGFCIGWTFTGWTRAWMMFGGLPLSLSIPWLTILQGVGFAFTLCVAMAVPPIIWLVRKQDETGGLIVQ